MNKNNKNWEALFNQDSKEAENLPHSSQNGSLIENAREMRKNPTIAESIIWNLLRNKKYGIKFRRQHIIGDFIVDFVDLKSGTVIEIDGGYHKNKDQIEADNLRTEILNQKGYSVIRFSNEEVIRNPEKIAYIIIQYITKQTNLPPC